MVKKNKYGLSGDRARLHRLLFCSISCPVNRLSVQIYNNISKNKVKNKFLQSSGPYSRGFMPSVINLKTTLTACNLINKNGKRLFYYNVKARFVF